MKLTLIRLEDSMTEIFQLHSTKKSSCLDFQSLSPFSYITTSFNVSLSQINSHIFSLYLRFCAFIINNKSSLRNVFSLPQFRKP